MLEISEYSEDGVPIYKRWTWTRDGDACKTSATSDRGELPHGWIETEVSISLPALPGQKVSSKTFSRQYCTACANRAAEFDEQYLNEIQRQIGR